MKQKQKQRSETANHVSRQVGHLKWNVLISVATDHPIKPKQREQRLHNLKQLRSDIQACFNTILSYTGKNIKFKMHLRFKPLQLTSVSALFPNNVRYVWMIQGITGGRRLKPTWTPWFIATSFIILQFPTTPPQLSVHWRWHHSLTHHRNRNQSKTGQGYCSLWSRAWTLGSRQNTIKRFVITPC